MSLLRIEIAALCINQGKYMLHRTIKKARGGVRFYP
jgi:hypothetical protein